MLRSIIVLMSVGFGLGGCSIYEAAHAPEPVNYKGIEVGEARSDVVSRVGFPQVSDKSADETIDHYQFTDGYNPASKARIILYVAGDFFTLGLTELVFWPLELAVLKGKQCHGTVTYGSQNRVVAYNIMDSDGVSLWSGMAPTPAASSTGTAPSAAATPVAASAAAGVPTSDPNVVATP